MVRSSGEGQRKVIVVTGAGSGIGGQVALELLRRGARGTAMTANSTAKQMRDLLGR